MQETIINITEYSAYFQLFRKKHENKLFLPNGDIDEIALEKIKALYDIPTLIRIGLDYEQFAEENTQDPTTYIRSLLISGYLLLNDNAFNKVGDYYSYENNLPNHKMSAIHYYEKSKSFFGYFRIGEIFLNDEEYSAARLYFEKALEINSSPQAKLYTMKPIIDCYLNEQKYEEAFNYSLLNFDPSNQNVLIYEECIIRLLSCYIKLFSANFDKVRNGDKSFLTTLQVYSKKISPIITDFIDKYAPFANDGTDMSVTYIRIKPLIDTYNSISSNTFSIKNKADINKNNLSDLFARLSGKLKEFDYILNYSSIASRKDDIIYGITQHLSDRLKKYASEPSASYSPCLSELCCFVEELAYDIFIIQFKNYLEDHKPSITNIQTHLKSTFDSWCKSNNLRPAALKYIYRTLLNIDQSTNLNNDVVSANLQRYIQQNPEKYSEKHLTSLNEFKSTSNYINLNSDEKTLVGNLIYLLETCVHTLPEYEKRIAQLNTFTTDNKKATLGTIWNLCFSDNKNLDTLKNDLIDFTEFYSNNYGDYGEFISNKLIQLLFKIECFRSLTRNETSHKSPLSLDNAIYGLDVCFLQDQSIFELFNNLFGNLIKQKTSNKENPVK